MASIVYTRRDSELWRQSSLGNRASRKEGKRASSGWMVGYSCRETASLSSH
jgi:hypothetical protein